MSLNCPYCDHEIDDPDEKYETCRTFLKRFSRSGCTMCQDDKPLDADVLQKIIDEETKP